MVRNGIPRVYFYSVLHGKEFRVVASSAEWIGTEFRQFASILIPRNGIPSYFLFRGRVQNGIPSFSVPRNNRNSIRSNHLFRLFRLPRNYFFVGNSQPYPHSDPLGISKRHGSVDPDPDQDANQNVMDLQDCHK
jgi:hypothetical protein